ncbi:MAG: DNA-processing protein DprA [Microgenomates group bacterium]|nr:DNA-processing protein DprA [Microgenomates group bacterium]
MTNLSYLAFSHFLGIGPMKFKAIKDKFGQVDKGYWAKQKDLKEILGNSLTEKFIHFRRHFDSQKKLKELREKNITVIDCDNKRYPPTLKNISDPPICLYIKGNVEFFDFEKEFFLAIVGTRRPTSYGEQIVRKLTADLGAAGFNIVSGMALGIDALAHRAALEAKAKTIAVLGCGVDIVYPALNFQLYQEIIKKRSLIISEFPPGQTVLKGLFIARNRIISGLVKGVLVVEGARDSGSLITARYAAEQGRVVFATPGPITSQMSEAPNILLKQGAKLVTSVEDILEEFNLRFLPQKTKETEAKLTPKEKEIYKRLKFQPKLVDELVEETKISVNIILNLLSALEIKGIVQKNQNGRYQIIL